MNEPEHLPVLSREDLLALVAELPCQIAILTAINEVLGAEIDQLTRGRKRQAAPCSLGIGVTEPKPPGRKPGTGSLCYRQAPPLEVLTEPPVDVPVTLDACPTCGGPLGEAGID